MCTLFLYIVLTTPCLSPILSPLAPPPTPPLPSPLPSPLPASLQFNRKEVIKHYSLYVNNFTTAMQILEKAIKKKTKFVTFLRRKYNQSKTSLSLQGLLLKPIQRFPQYILFLQVR